MNFEEWWASLPSAMKRGNKPRAAMRYHTIEKKGELTALQEALAAYMEDQKHNSWRSWLQAPSFLGRWREWVAEDRTEALADDSPVTHICSICDPEHVYQEDEADRASWPSAWLYACPKRREKMRSELDKKLAVSR